MHHIAIQNWRRAVLGEQRDLPRVLASLVERFDRSAPRGFLPSLISPRYSTCRCTVRPPDTRRFSTMLQ
jgi:hypothetical protein